MRLILLMIITALLFTTSSKAQNILSMREQGTVSVIEKIDRNELEEMLVKYGHSLYKGDELATRVGSVAVEIECKNGFIKSAVYHKPDNQSSVRAMVHEINQAYKMVDVTSNNGIMKIRNMIITSGGVTTKYIINQLRILAISAESIKEATSSQKE